MTPSRNFEDYLPDGSCFSRVLKVEPQFQLNTESTIKKVEYIGSFPVSGNDQNERTEFVRTQLKEMRNTGPKKSVLLVLSLSGIKVCSLNGKSVLMAHALRRISFATCDPEHHQFSFLAREPNGHFSLQYCHSFLAEDPKTAEELSGIVGSAFRMAYAQQLQQTPHQLEPQPARRRSPGPVLLGPAALLVTCRDDRSPKPATRACWAKKLVGKTKYNDSAANQDMELSNRSFSSNISECSNTSPPLTPMNNSKSNRSTPNNLPVDLWSPLGGGCSSCEENNSPTDVNSCKHIKDKPPLLKNLEVVKENILGDEKFNKDIKRPASGGYVNENTSWGNSQAAAPKFNTNIKTDGFAPVKKFSLGSRNQAPTAPPTDEESLLEMSTDQSSKRSSRSSCDQSVPSLSSSLSDTTILSERSDVSSCCKNKKVNHNGSASSITPPPPPERHDSLYIAVTEERELRVAPWFQAGIPREIALEVLAQEPVGSFMVRESTSKPGCFALSLRVPRDFHQTGIAHYLIMRTNRGYKIKGFTKEFSTLTALITHHSVMPELLPCPLSLSRYNPSFRRQDSEDMVDMNEDPDYNLLSDFRKMLADVNV
ncbi:SH2 domain-containing protein 5 [Argiope bruennichi]|uniref:SH2 domain-containing protein 5 n=2 Tax=Argiope bruennichi TaxID=94029 RepID=A0A8T0FL66_ARGBR|nr:SH2 domain-containing protein 5 [Argiope bruennichi]